MICGIAISIMRSAKLTVVDPIAKAMPIHHLLSRDTESCLKEITLGIRKEEPVVLYSATAAIVRSTYYNRVCCVNESVRRATNARSTRPLGIGLRI
jgi:hypothetical protein